MKATYKIFPLLQKGYPTLFWIASAETASTMQPATYVARFCRQIQPQLPSAGMLHTSIQPQNLLPVPNCKKLVENAGVERYYQYNTQEIS